MEKKPLYFIRFNKLKIFDLDANPFKEFNPIRFNTDKIQWEFVNTKFDFYSDNHLITSQSCSPKLNDWAMLSAIRTLSLKRSVQFSEKSEMYKLDINFKLSLTSIKEKLKCMSNSSSTQSALQQVAYNIFIRLLSRNNWGIIFGRDCFHFLTK